MKKHTYPPQINPIFSKVVTREQQVTSDASNATSWLSKTPLTSAVSSLNGPKKQKLAAYPEYWQNLSAPTSTKDVKLCFCAKE